MPALPPGTAVPRHCPLPSAEFVAEALAHCRDTLGMADVTEEDAREVLTRAMRYLWAFNLPARSLEPGEAAPPLPHNP